MSFYQHSLWTTNERTSERTSSLHYLKLLLIATKANATSKIQLYNVLSIAKLQTQKLYKLTTNRLSDSLTSKCDVLLSGNGQEIGARATHALVKYAHSVNVAAAFASGLVLVLAIIAIARRKMERGHFLR